LDTLIPQLSHELIAYRTLILENKKHLDRILFSDQNLK